MGAAHIFLSAYGFLQSIGDIEMDYNQTLRHIIGRNGKRGPTSARELDIRIGYIDTRPKLRGGQAPGNRAIQLAAPKKHLDSALASIAAKDKTKAVEAIEQALHTCEFSMDDRVELCKAESWIRSGDYPYAAAILRKLREGLK
jgi:hypothetical protein